LQKHYQDNPLVRGLTPKLKECNYTPLNEYCPEHGLEDCYGQSVYEGDNIATFEEAAFESELARIKSLSSFK
jgi:hypothetical protein